MKKLITIFTLFAQIAFLSAPAFATPGRILQADVIHGLGNALRNPSFERTTYDVDWVYTTITRNSVAEVFTIAPGSGKQAAKLSFTAQTGAISQSQIPAWNTNNVMMEGSCKVNTALGTIQVCGLANAVEQNCQSVSGTGTWQYVPATFSGPSNGTSIGVKVKTTASTTGTVYVDDCYAGPARNTGTINVPLQPTIQKFLSGTGTYTLPTNPAPSYIDIQMVGGGGGGSGSGTSGAGSGVTGGTTCLSSASSCTGTVFAQATGGAGGLFNGAGGGGGSGSSGTGVIGFPSTGGGGASGMTQVTVNDPRAGSTGGSSLLGGGAAAPGYSTAGISAAANSGGGGSGAGDNNVSGGGESGSGGGGGGFVHAIISNTSTAWASSYSYSVGTGGTAGGAGTSGFAGGAGGSGVIIVTEYYQPQNTQVYSAANGGLSVGDISYTSQPTCPIGTIQADGTNRATGTFPQLEAAYWVSSAWLYGGTGTLSSGTWNTPNLKGIFIRGTGSQTIGGITYTGTLGTVQGDQLQGHFHGLATGATFIIGNGTGSNTSINATSNQYATTTITGPTSDGTNGTPRTGTETRPANIGMLACVRTVPASAAPVIIGSSNSYINATANTANYTLLPNDSTVKMDATSGNLTATLPDATAIKGQIYTVAKVDTSANKVTVNTTSSQTINGQTSIQINAGRNTLTVQSDGSNWIILGGIGPFWANIASGCTISAQGPFNWIASITHPITGQCSLTFVTSMFNASNVGCTATVYNAHEVAVFTGAPSNTGVTVDQDSAIGGAPTLADAAFSIQCNGSR